MIKLIVISLFISSNISVASIVTTRPHNKVYNHILKNKPGINPTYAQALSKAIYSYSNKYSMDPIEISAILRQECGYKLNCVNNISKDYGVGQINDRTIKAFGFDKKLLLSDVNYSVEATMIVLADFRRMYGHKEKNWVCRYNAGTGSWLAIRYKCNRYRSMVARYL